MKTSPEGRALIEHFEGRYYEVYRDPIGLPTVGVGHLVRPEDNLKVGDRVTDEQIERFLDQDLAKAEAIVGKVLAFPDQHHFDALVSMAFNLGNAPFVKGTGFRKALDEDRYSDIPAIMKLYRKAGGKVLPGLVRRREAEARMFQGLDWRTPAPSSARSLRRGSSGPDVLALTQALVKLRLMSFPSSRFGPRTQQAVVMFQMANNLEPDGIWGPKSAKALEGMGP